MKKLILTTLILCSLRTLFAQSAQSMYFELGGPGIAAFNFDSRFNGREDGIGGRIGIGGFGAGGSTVILVPLQLNYLLGTDRRHYFEVGAGATFASYHDSYGDDGGPFSATFGHLYFGYRVQPANGGFYSGLESIPFSAMDTLFRIILPFLLAINLCEKGDMSDHLLFDSVA